MTATKTDRWIIGGPMLTPCGTVSIYEGSKLIACVDPDYTKLIVALPELLTACRGALEFFESQNAGDCDDAKQLRAAIAKATP
jgi:hypothetical protein